MICIRKYSSNTVHAFTVKCDVWIRICVLHPIFVQENPDPDSDIQKLNAASPKALCYRQQEFPVHNFPFHGEKGEGERFSPSPHF
jgi:hypothetical protein